MRALKVRSYTVDYFAGIDVGSLSTEAVVLEDGNAQVQLLALLGDRLAGVLGVRVDPDEPHSARAEPLREALQAGDSCRTVAVQNFDACQRA